MKTYLGLLGIIVLFSCKQHEVVEETITTQDVHASSGVDTAMVGHWYANTLDVQYDFATDSLQQELVVLEDFPEVLGIANVLAIYKEDGSFSSTYIGLKGEDLYTEEGRWYAEGDSLYIIYSPADQLDTFAYHFWVDGKVGVFKSIIDWDQDGRKDDHLTLTSLKVID